MEWKTYLILYFGTGGKKPTEVEEILGGLGFKSEFGPVDFTYEWENKPNKEQVLELADKIAEALSGSGVVFNIDTHD